MTAPVTIVTGFGRCGSSLAMQMLSAGGMPCAGEYPAFELSVAAGPQNLSWLSDYQGRAVKILDPQYHQWPMKVPFRFIWLDRDRNEQSKSSLKFLQFNGVPVNSNRATRRSIARSFYKDRPKCMQVFKSLTNQNPLFVLFEAILAGPKVVADVLSNFVGGGLDTEAMAKVVIPRGPKCLPGLLELELLQAASS